MQVGKPQDSSVTEQGRWNWQQRRALAAAAMLLLTGCAARQGAGRSWRVEGVLRGHVLVPPGAEARKGVFVVKAARSAKNFSGPACTLDSADVSFRWRGRDAKVRTNLATLTATPDSLATATQAEGRVAPVGEVRVASANWFEQVLRPALKQQTEKGCLTAAELSALDRRLIDNLTLPSAAHYRLRFGEVGVKGFIDVTSEFRLRAVEPIREGGEATGYLTSFYVLSRSPDGGVTVSRGASEANVRAKLTTGTASDSELLHLPASATWLRLFFRTWSSAGDRRIALIAAPSAAERERASEEFESDPEGYCSGAAKQRGVACVAVAKDMVLGPELRVMVNGKEAFSPVEGNLREVLQTAGVRDGRTVLGTLSVQRPYEGKLAPVEFDRTKADILGLVLIGGEQITW